MPRIERHVTLPPARESARRARQVLKEALLAGGHEEWLDNAELALSEIVTNATLHAHTDIDIAVVVSDDSVCVEVRDYDQTLPIQRHYGDEALTGRGLGLVAALTQQCGVQSLGESGKVVWFCVGAAEESPSPDALIDAWAVDFDDDFGNDFADTPPTACQDIVLQAMPVALWLAAREHHDAIIRELCHYNAANGDAGLDIAAADKARSTVSAMLITVLGRDEALQGGRTPECIDLTVSIPVDASSMYASLQDVLDFAEQLAVDGELLVRPALPEIVAVRDWACEQVIAQLAGTAPSPWPGTAQERFETEVRDQKHEPAQWDRAAVTESTRAIVAADEANRIVAVSAAFAELVGWDANALVGRRVVTVVPPALREAHVAGFSRHLSTGESKVLGRTVEVPVLAADGSERLCRLLIERAHTEGGRAVYLAWFEPLPPA